MYLGIHQSTKGGCDKAVAGRYAQSRFYTREALSCDCYEAPTLFDEGVIPVEAVNVLGDPAPGPRQQAREPRLAATCRATGGGE
jgi:hypothetical protein